MIEKSLEWVIEKAKNSNEVVIVGAGKRGKALLEYLRKEEKISIKAFFDNNESMVGECINNIPVLKAYKMREEGDLYIIAVDALELRRELYIQLQELGIRKEDIIYYCRDYNYLRSLNERYYEDELKAMYFERFGKKLNLENPVTYNEKINWEKLHVKDRIRTRLSDKYLVRKWVEEKIGKEYLTQIYGVWDEARDINFEELPNSFVLKLNNGSGRNIIVKDKSKINWEEVCRQLNEWKEVNYAYTLLEMHYKDIIPKILCEEYLEGVAESVYDYNIYCFYGEPEYIWCIKGSHRPGCQASFYDKNWTMQSFSYGYPKDPIPAPKPRKLAEMLELSRVLSKDFKHVRVDWYNLPDGRIIFGEMTFSSWGGLEHWVPEEYDYIFGKLI